MGYGRTVIVDKSSPGNTMVDAKGIVVPRGQRRAICIEGLNQIMGSDKLG